MTDQELLTCMRRVHVKLMREAMDDSYTAEHAITEAELSDEQAKACRDAMDATGETVDLERAYWATKTLRRREARRALASGEFDWVARMR